jgi:hypothetical protein
MRYNNTAFFSLIKFLSSSMLRCVVIGRNPLVSYVYERGWRQGFAWAGFPGMLCLQPGIEQQSYLSCKNTNGTICDASRGMVQVLDFNYQLCVTICGLI